VYSETLMRWFRSQAHAGEMEAATHCGQAGAPGLGPYLRIWLKVEAGIVRSARFATYGCPTAIACGEAICTVSEGRELERVQSMTSLDVTHLVGGVPEGKEHCPALAAEALSRTAPMTEG
jgi:nitrogen fixation NifU-like protein